MKKIMMIVLAAITAAAMLAGCAADNGSAGGSVSTDGSTSMEKVIGALGESFMANNQGTTFTYNPTGSGSGIKAVLEGRCDIGLDLETIAKLYTGEITNWKDAGGSDAEVVLIGREAGSGTRDGFESITGTADKCQYRQELTSTGDVITTVSQNPNAIGYASLASLKDSVKALTVGGVAPTEDTVKDGSYVVQRPFVLVTKEGTALSETAQKFFDYATSADAADIIAKAGAVAAN